MNDNYFFILNEINEGRQEDFSIKNSTITPKEFGLIVEKLQDGGLIKNAVLQYGGDEPGPIFASISAATITLLGENILKEKNSK